MKKIIKKLITSNPQNINELGSFRRKMSKDFKISLLSNMELLKFYRQLLKNKEIKKNKDLELLLKKRAIRTLSGVAPIAVLTKPYPCPGKCFYCPSEKNMPKSYLSNEPAVMRAVLCKFGPYKQVMTRLNALKITGHLTDKIELIVMGGTWNYLPEKYQNWFMKRCFDAFNGKTSKNLIRAQKMNEKTEHRCVGITLETRPDYLNQQEIKKMRKLGCTKVEMGAQTLNDSILQLNCRGHNVKDIVKATQLLKDAGFKVGYHMMPNLFGSTPAKDLAVFKRLFADENFRPDYLKIYPCVVTKGSPLYKAWRDGKYKPYSDKVLLELLINIKKYIPPYTRIIRLIRDIPSTSILAGNKISNLREMVKEEMRKKGLRCRCIRCREIKNLKFKIENCKLKILSYPASGGKEYFISYEDEKNDPPSLPLGRTSIPTKASDDESKSELENQKKLRRVIPQNFKQTGGDDKIIAFLRLRITNNAFLNELKDAAIIRELHTYGPQVRIDEKNKSAAQHFGFGKKLMLEAEAICRKEKIKKIAVISGIGARGYYKKLGYKLEGTYLIKTLTF